MSDLVAAVTPSGATVFTSRENAKNSKYEIKRSVDVVEPPKYPAEKSDKPAKEA